MKRYKGMKQRNQKSILQWIDQAKKQFPGMAESMLNRLVEKQIDLEQVIGSLDTKQLQFVLTMAAMQFSAGSAMTRDFFSALKNKKD